MNRRDEILRVARDLFLEAGPGAVTLRGVASRVKISATAIYRHFDNKDDLLRQVVDHGRERFTGYLMGGLAGAEPFERLVQVGERYLDFAFENPHDYRVMFMSWDRLEPGVHAPVPGGHTPTFQFLLDRVRECLPAEQASPQAVLALALLFWAECHGLASLYLAGGGAAAMPLEAYRGLGKQLVRRLAAAVLARA